MLLKQLHAKTELGKMIYLQVINLKLFKNMLYIVGINNSTLH